MVELSAFGQFWILVNCHDVLSREVEPLDFGQGCNSLKAFVQSALMPSVAKTSSHNANDAPGLAFLSLDSFGSDANRCYFSFLAKFKVGNRTSMLMIM